jgi:DNA modification methylase
MRIDLRQGDCVVRLKEIEDGSLGAVVSDPPYGLEFMRGDDEWKETWKYGIRKLGFKGSSALPTFTASRNPVCRKCHKHMRGSKNHVHCVCELPDYDQTDHMIRDRQAYQDWCRTWLEELFRVVQPGGQVLLFGGSRMYHRMTMAMEEVGFTDLQLAAWCYFSGFPKSHSVARGIDDRLGAERPMIRVPASQVRDAHEKASPEPVSEEAIRYEGYGTALKPAWEPVVMANRP